MPVFIGDGGKDDSRYKSCPTVLHQFRSFVMQKSKVLHHIKA